ncbi:uncharacterized protein LOC110037101 [Phalaenopsis equestris]|uniref:uncharacterized protein LOC110037101 n=1 Tax=Phalaenopsis equestris TaxID=78828 RepID=UPI0009E445DF|nr:uncharacterized protein LOC110037101 [Phalaenopsis equestris]
MENNIKVFAMTMLCVLFIAVASNASEVKHRALAVEDKGDGKPNESEKVASSPPSIPRPIQNAAPTVQGHPSPPQSNQSMPNSDKSDTSSSKSSPLVDSSTKTVPPPGPENLNPGASSQGEDNAPLNPSTKEKHKASETPKKEGDKPVQSPMNEGDKAPRDPEKREDMVSQAPTKDNMPNGSHEIVDSEGDKSKNKSCETANDSNLTCQKGALVACLLPSGIESTEFFLLVQNTRADDLNVNIKNPSNIKIDSTLLSLPKHSNKKFNLTADASRDLIITLTTGEGDCVLTTKTSISDGFHFQQFPAYATQLRPMHGAYFLFATFIIICGTWACCKFGRTEKRVDAGIPYQQLEMAMHTQPSSVTANEVPADGWDQSWDDDWDDEEAVIRTADKKVTESVPSNGLSSRSATPAKDGWEIDWDD